MNDQPDKPNSSSVQIDRLCDEFEAAWRAGLPPRVEDYLARIEESSRGALLRELLLSEWELLRSRNQPLDLEPYLRRFPDDSELVREAFQKSLPPQTAPLLIAHYRVVRKLGAGGMGEVYLAQDTRLDRQVALKLLPRELADDPRRRQRLLTEAKAASALNHPNVCVIHEVGEMAGQRPYIAMEFVAGHTLAAQADAGRLEIREIVEIGLQVADALDAAFAKGIVHRDIKPSNICLNERGQVKVLDFGLAKRLGSDDEGQAVPAEYRTSTGQVLGTPHYMSPEQAIGKEVDHRSDLFSLGVVLYELVTGRPPFPGSNVGEIIDRILRAQPEALARFNYEVPPELERIIRKCLEKDRDSRYQSPRELLVDLRNLRRELERGASTSDPATTRLASSVGLPAPTGSRGDSRALAGTTPLTPEPVSVEVLKESDIFINYAAIDDQSILEGRQGWVSQFHRNLEIRLQQLTGEAVKIARHTGMTGQTTMDGQILDHLPALKAMVSVVSPPFIKSNGCCREVEEFWRSAEQSGGLWVEEKPRLFKVVKTPVPPHEIPPALAELFSRLFGFEFYEKFSETGRMREFDEAFGPLLKQRFHERIYDLASEVSQVLRILRQLETESAPLRPENPARRFVYLATTTSDLQEERDRIKRELSERGHVVLPDAPLPSLATEVDRVVLACLEKCSLAIHLLGRHYGVTPEDSADSVQVLQVKLTAQRARKTDLARVLWIPGGATSPDARQKAFIRQVQEDPDLHHRADLIEGNLSLLKQTLIHHLSPPPERKALPAPAGVVAEGARKVYLICEPRDEEAIAPLEDYLFSQGLEVCLPAFDGSDADAEALHRDNLIRCDAVIVYYGVAPRAWVDIKVRELLKAPGYGRSSPITLQAVLIAPPEDRRKERFRSLQARVIQQPGSFAPDAEMGAFVKAVKEVRK